MKHMIQLSLSQKNPNPKRRPVSKMKMSNIFAASVSIFALAACSQQQQPIAPQANQAPLYASVNECVQAGNTAQLCTEALQQASTNTPHYNNIDQCAAEYGYNNCHNNGGWFGPALMGFMVGNMLAHNSNGYYAGGHYGYNYDYYHRYYNRPTVVIHTYTPGAGYSSAYRTAPAAASAPTVTRNGFATATPVTSATARPASVTTTATTGQVVTATRGGTGFGSNTTTTTRAVSTSSFGSSPSRSSSSFGSSSSSSSHSSGGGFGGGSHSSGGFS
jgi:uncharacterized protein YgiB involved in biofilm formation